MTNDVVGASEAPKTKLAHDWPTVAAGLQTRFQSRFGARSTVFRAPGRVNLIGEHTDYNDGFVMPVAIDASTWVAIAPRADRRIMIYSEQFNEEFAFDLDDNAKRKSRWTDYVQGVAVILSHVGFRLEGADILIDSTVPIGAGLSSSAALEV